MPASRSGRGYDAKVTPQHNVKIPLKTPLSHEKRNKVPEIQVPGMRWYVCTTVPMAELKAAQSLRNTVVGETKPFAAYAPCEFFWRRPVRGNLKMPPREVQRPAMRHYLFVGIEGGITDETMAALRTRDAEGRNTHGLVSILGSHMKGALPMNEKGLIWLDKQASNERAGLTNMTPPPPFARDDEVRIAKGTMAGFVSRVLTVDLEGEELIVALSLLGAETEMRLTFDDAHKVGVGVDFR